MKNTLFKKATAIFLSLILMLACAQTAFAQDELTPPEETTSGTPEAPEVPSTPEVPEPPEDGSGDSGETDGNETVAKVSLFCAMYVFPVSGHTWIYVENLSDSPITVGLYEVPVGQGVSVGTFSFSVADGWGLYYNLEAYRENRNDNIHDCRSITKDLTQSELEELSDSIKNYPNMWDIFIFNCTFFAFSIWNHNTDYFFIPMMIPALAALEVIIMGGKKGVTPMYYPTADQVFRQVGTGDSATLEPVGEKTINN